MKVAGIYSFNNGEEVIQEKYSALRKEVESAIANTDASLFKTKKSKEKTKLGKMLYSPPEMNGELKRHMFDKGWKSVRVKCDYSIRYYSKNYDPKKLNKGAYREMDFVKQKLGVEIQFGKYSFMVYNVAAKMTIFSNLGYIDTGIEVVPVKALADEMSSGVSYFEQFVWDLEKRGVSNIDLPVLILGIDA